jgi:hypothetical protein
MKIKKKHRWMFNYILIHVARTWERIRVMQPHEEMRVDNITSAEDSIPDIAEEIFLNDIIQGFVNASEEVKSDDYWGKNTGTMSDCYIEELAHDMILKEYVR